MWPATRVRSRTRAAGGGECLAAAEFGRSGARLPTLDAPDSRTTRQRRQYGSIPVLDTLAPACPPDAAKAAGSDGARSVHPGAHLRLRTGAVGRRGRGGFAGAPAAGVLRPARRSQICFWSALTRRRCTRPATLFGLVHCAGRGRARCRSPPTVRQIDSKDAAFCAACGARLRGATPEGTSGHEDSLADSGCGRRRGDVRIARRLAARGRLRRGYRVLRPRRRREGPRCATTPSTSST